jgi:polyphosphate glucokinase
MRVLSIDIGGTNVKLLATGQKARRRFASGRMMTPQLMAAHVKALAKDWKYDVVSVGYPGPVEHDRPMAEPRNLAKGWLEFDFEAAFKRPVKLINDAAMQALGSYRHGTMLFLGFGTGLGAALVVEGVVVPMELGRLAYRKGTYEDYLGRRALERLGKRKWRKHVAKVVGRLVPILHLDDVVLGGGNAKKMKPLPEGCRTGDNAHAFVGGFRMWDGVERGARAAEVRPAGRRRSGAQTHRGPQ